MEQFSFPSIKLRGLLPQHIRDNYPLFHDFLQLYFEQYELQGGGYDFLAHILQYGDVDDTTLEFLEYKIDQYLGRLNEKIITDDTLVRTDIIDKRTLIKNIKQHYRAVGSEKSIQFIINALFGEQNVDIIYPWDNTLTVSESDWSVGIFIKLDPISSSISGIKNSQIIGLTSGSQAIIELHQLENYAGYGSTSVLKLNGFDPVNNVDNFEIGEKIKIISYETGEELVSESDNITILSILSELDFSYKGSFYSVKDPVYITSGTGAGAIFRVESINSGQIDSLKIIKPGINYSVGDTITAESGNDFGTGFTAVVHTVNYWGGIEIVEIYNHGVDYSVAPNIVISSENGSGAILIPEGENIGSIAEIEEFDGGVGYDLSTVIDFDYTFQLKDVVGIFTLNKTIEGIESGATATVRTFNTTTDILNVSEIISGNFLEGEYIIEQPFGTLTPTLGNDTGNSRIVTQEISEVFYPTAGTDVTFAAEDFTGISILEVDIIPSLDYCINGSFDKDSSDWTKGTDWSISLGKAKKVSGTGSDFTNELPYSNDFSQWTNNGITATKNEVGISGEQNTAWTLEDGDSSLNSIEQSATISSSTNPNVAVFYIKKTTNASSFPGISLQLTDGTGIDVGATLNTDNGTIVDRTGFAPDDSKVMDFGDFWKAMIEVADNGTGNTTIITELFPSVNADSSGTWDAATTGDCISDSVEIYLNKNIDDVKLLYPIYTEISSESIQVSSLDQTINGLTSGKIYKCEYDSIGISSGKISAKINGSGNVEQLLTDQEKTHSVYFLTDATSETLNLEGYDFEGFIDNVSITETSEVVEDGNFVDIDIWGSPTNWFSFENSARCFGETGNLVQASGLTVNDTKYLVSFSVSDNGLNPFSGSFTLDIHGETTDDITEEGEYSFMMVSGSSGSNITITPTDFFGAISNLSIIPATEMVVNGSFDVDLYGWTPVADFTTASGWSRDVVNNWAECDGTQLTFVELYQTVTTGTTDDYVKLSFDITRDSENFGDILIYVDGYPITGEILYDGSTTDLYLYAESTDPVLTIVASPIFSGYIDNVSFKTVTGNGPETLGTERVTDPDFSLGTGWTYGTDSSHQDPNDDINPTNWTHLTSGEAYAPGTQLAEIKIGQDITTTTNQVYDVSYDVVTSQNGKVRFDISGGVVEEEFSNAIGKREFNFRGAGGTEHFDIIADINFAGRIDNVSIKPSSNFIINGKFTVDDDAGSNGWTTGVNWSIPNVGFAVADNSSASLEQTIYNLTSGLNYKITYTVSDYSSGSIKSAISGGIDIEQDNSSNGTYSSIFTATATSHIVQFTGTTFTGKLSNISVELSEELSEDGNFNDNSTWSTTNWTYDGSGTISISGVGTEESITEVGAIPASVGIYDVILEIDSISDGSVWVNLGDTTGATGDGPILTTSGTHQFSMISGSDGSISILAEANSDIVISSISVIASESLIVNKSFDYDLYWTTGTGWSISSGGATHEAGTGLAGSLSQTLQNFTANVPYLLTYIIVGVNSALFCKQNVAEANPIVGAVNRRTGSWLSTKSHLDYDKYIQDSYYYQKFSYVIDTDQDKEDWIDVINGIHPAGTIVFGNLEKTTNKYYTSYGGSLGPYTDTLEFYKFDDIESTQTKDFFEWQVSDVESSTRHKTFRCPGSQINLVIT